VASPTGQTTVPYLFSIYSKNTWNLEGSPKNSSGTTLGKGNAIKWGAIGNTLGERNENFGNIIGNMIGTHTLKISIFTPHPPAPSPKGKKMNPPGHAYSILRHCCHHFCASANTPSTEHIILGVLILFHIN
jgi:hypothetical protein